MLVEKYALHKYYSFVDFQNYSVGSFDPLPPSLKRCVSNNYYIEDHCYIVQ